MSTGLEPGDVIAATPGAIDNGSDSLIRRILGKEELGVTLSEKFNASMFLRGGESRTETASTTSILFVA